MADMSHEAAARILTGLHLKLIRTSKAVNRKRSLRASEKAMWLAELTQQRLALAVAYRALTGTNLTADQDPTA
jgi:hypothetical protein